MRQSIDFIGVGAARCGTSWLANILRAHPHVCLSEPKEIRYFNRQLLPTGTTRGEPNPNADKLLDWYLAHFAHAGKRQLCGEYTPAYFSDKAAPEAIRRHFPSARLIVSLRNPVDRAWSHYWQQRGLGLHSIPTFEQAIDEGVGYLEMSLYARQLKRYRACFDRDQILVIIFEELIRSPENEVGRLYRFLGLDAGLGADPGSLHRNPTLELRSRRLKNVVRRTSQALSGIGLGGLQHSLRRLGADRLWHGLMSKPIERPPMSERQRAQLEAFFTDDIAELEGLIDRDLGIWRRGRT